MKHQNIEVFIWDVWIDEREEVVYFVTEFVDYDTQESEMFLIKRKLLC